MYIRSIAILSLNLFFAAAGFPQNQSQDLRRYAVILSDPAPVTARAKGGKAAVAAARARLQPLQQAMKTRIEALQSRSAGGIHVTGAAHTLLNAIFVEASPADAEQLKSLPGVTHVAPLKRFHRTLDRAEQLINVPAAWSLLGGVTNAGAGIKIGVIDTGIEATHPAFQDPSLTPPAGFPACKVFYPENFTQQGLDCAAADASKGFPICSSATCAYTNNKVIVARSYVPVLTSASAGLSRPDDPSPRDRVGHGTAVAMAAAGMTSSGPADTITGVAPKAFLGSYKVFGSADVNDVTSGDVIIEALEDAFLDNMDIVVLSLGAPALSGPLDSGRTCGLSFAQSCDPEAFVVNEAVLQGMLVVVAAGNSGQTGLPLQPGFGTMNSPGDAPAAIAVAAITNSHSWGNNLTVNGLGTYHSRFGDGPAPTATLTGPLGDVASVGDPQACTAPPAGSLTGMIVLVQRGTCTFAVKVQAIQSAGAAGVIVTNNTGDDTLLSPSGLGGTSIPTSFVGFSDGVAIQAYLASNPKATVIIDPKFSSFDITTFNQVAPFSSHGPTTGTAAIKPDIAAVGVDLYLAGESYDPNGELYSPNGFLVSQGTSFSAPQVAGVAALVKQAHPGMSALDIKSAIVNTATQDVTENGVTASVLAVGSGKANAAFAVQNTLMVSPTNASFGIVSASPLPVTQQFQLTNIGMTPLTLSVALERRTPEITAHTSIDRPNLTIAPNATDNINLTLSGTAPAPGIYEGFVTIAGAPNPVKIPYLYLVGDGIPKNLISMAGNGDDGIVGQRSRGGYIIVQVLDQYGVAVQNLPVTFAVTSGGGSLTPLANTTDNYGIGLAAMILGPNPGANTYTVTAGTLSANFQATGNPQPVITPNGIVNAANYTGGAIVPGSYISIYGSDLAQVTGSNTTPILPIALNNVTVSFDNPNVSVPGHLVFVSPGQVNVQVPWELAGQPSVQMKVSVGDSSGVIYTTPVAASAPAFFELSAQTHAAAALDEGNNIVTVSNPVARGHVVQLFANGLGPVTNQPASGDPAPSNPLAYTTETPLVTIGGLNAAVQFSGMPPGNAGLYQINVVVPPTSTSGSQPVTISIGGVSGTTSFLPVR
jgi:uncharacterized protein (TIGR03437 family)